MSSDSGKFLTGTDVVQRASAHLHTCSASMEVHLHLRCFSRHTTISRTLLLHNTTVAQTSRQCSDANGEHSEYFPKQQFDDIFILSYFTVIADVCYQHAARKDQSSYIVVILFWDSLYAADL